MVHMYVINFCIFFCSRFAGMALLWTFFFYFSLSLIWSFHHENKVKIYINYDTVLAPQIFNNETAKPYPLNTTADNAAWTGLTKTDNLPKYLKGYIGEPQSVVLCKSLKHIELWGIVCLMLECPPHVSVAKA